MSLEPFAIALIAVASLSACVAPPAYDRQVPKTVSYQSLDAHLHDELAADAARIEQLPHLVRLTLSDVLFTQDSAQPSDAGKAMLAKLGPALSGLKGRQVVVKSFTDSVSAGIEPPARFPSTVPLTQARAAAVAALLQQQGVAATLVYTSGLGDSHIVASNDTPQGRAKNRRVVIDIVAAPA